MSTAKKEDIYDLIRTYHQTAFQYLSDAIRIDEESQGTSDGNGMQSKLKAIKLYKNGIAELEKGLSVPLSKNKCSERSMQLKLKMETNLKMATDRLGDLENVQRASNKTVGPRSARPLPDGPRTRSSMAPSAASGRSVSPPKLRLQPKSKRNCDDLKNNVNDAIMNKVKQKVKGIDPKLGNLILDQVLECNTHVTFNDIAGLEKAKQALLEVVILPALKPELFTGLRSPVQGLLLFGPPGNGKTLLAKAVASEAKSVFFNISASALTSKWVGEAEKLVKALFVLARDLQPSIIFIDEIDSILSERRDSDNEVSRRLKTEFLLQFDGVVSSDADRLLVMGATNRPFDLDQAILRRFPKRIFIDLPNRRAREDLLQNLLNKSNMSLSDTDLGRVASMTDGYSGSDLTNLAKDAAMGPIREITVERLKNLHPSQLRAVTVRDFEAALQRVRSSTNPEHIRKLADFNTQYGDIRNDT